MRWTQWSINHETFTRRASWGLIAVMVPCAIVVGAIASDNMPIAGHSPWPGAIGVALALPYVIWTAYRSDKSS